MGGVDPRILEAKTQGYVPIRRGQVKLGYSPEGAYPYTLLVPDPETAPLVRTVYALFAQGATSQEVARQVPKEARLHFPPDVTEAYVPRYLASLVKDITYEGYIRVGTRLVAGKHEPIVSEALALAARGALSQADRRHAGRMGRAHVEARRKAFEEGYWPQATKRAYGTELHGAHPCYTLVPGEGFQYIQEAVERLARGDRVVDVEVWVQRHAPTPAHLFGRNEGGSVWDPYRLKQLLEHPAYRGLTRHRGETRPARWAPMLDEAKLREAIRRLDEERTRRRCA